jgi:hypothetical protein
MAQRIGLDFPTGRENRNGDFGMLRTGTSSFALRRWRAFDCPAPEACAGFLEESERAASPMRMYGKLGHRLVQPVSGRLPVLLCKSAGFLPLDGCETHMIASEVIDDECRDKNEVHKNKAH